MSELNDKLLEIKRQKDTYILPENLKKDVTAFGVTGTYEGSGGTSDVKLFKTIAAMQADTNPHEGDLAIVYDKIETSWNGEEVSLLKVLDKFELPIQYTSLTGQTASLGIYPWEIDDYYFIGMVLQNEYAHIEVKHYENQVETNIGKYVYSSQDGIHYEKDDMLSTGNITYLDYDGYKYDFDYWDTTLQQQFLSMFKKLEYTFEGLYEYKTNQYVLAKTQLNANINDILTDKIAYSKNGVIIGNDSIYNNLDQEKILQYIYKLDKHILYDSEGSDEFEIGNVYGNISKYAVMGGDNISTNITYLKESDTNIADVDIIFKPDEKIVLDIDTLLDEYSQYNIEYFSPYMEYIDNNYYYLSYYLEYSEITDEENITEINGIALFDKSYNFVKKKDFNANNSTRQYNENTFYYTSDNNNSYLMKYNILDNSTTTLYTLNYVYDEITIYTFNNYVMYVSKNSSSNNFDVIVYNIVNSTSTHIIDLYKPNITTFKVSAWLIIDNSILYVVEYDGLSSAYKVAFDGTSTIIYEDVSNIQHKNWVSTYLSIGDYKPDTHKIILGEEIIDIMSSVSSDTRLNAICDDVDDIYGVRYEYRNKGLVLEAWGNKNTKYVQLNITQYEIDENNNEFNILQYNERFENYTNIVMDNKAYPAYPNVVETINGLPTKVIMANSAINQYLLYNVNNIKHYNISTKNDYDEIMINTSLPEYYANVSKIEELYGNIFDELFIPTSLDILLDRETEFDMVLPTIPGIDWSEVTSTYKLKFKKKTDTIWHYSDYEDEDTEEWIEMCCDFFPGYESEVYSSIIGYDENDGQYHIKFIINVYKENFTDFDYRLDIDVLHPTKNIYNKTDMNFNVNIPTNVLYNLYVTGSNISSVSDIGISVKDTNNNDIPYRAAYNRKFGGIRIYLTTDKDGTISVTYNGITENRTLDTTTNLENNIYNQHLTDIQFN